MLKKRDHQIFSRAGGRCFSCGGTATHKVGKHLKTYIDKPYEVGRMLIHVYVYQK